MSDVKLGQRIAMSEKDVLKLNKMYSDPCHNYRDSDVDHVEKWVNALEWVNSMFGF